MPNPGDESLYRSFRNKFPIFRSKVYLNSCSQGALSDGVEESMKAFLESWREDGSPWDRWVEAQEELRAEIADLIGAAPDEIGITYSASNAIYALASGLDYGRRPEIVLGDLEFPTGCHIWLAQQQRGARVKWLAAPEGRLTSEDYRRAVGERTLIVPAAHVCFRNGYRIRPAEIARVAHEAGALFLLDDYQSCGTRLVRVADLGVDFYVAGALKYLLGPSGVAFLYVRRDRIRELRPTFTGWFAQENPFSFDIHRHEPAGSANRFQSGTPPIPSIYGALAGIRLLKQIGLENVASRIAVLTAAFIEGALQRGFVLKTPVDSSGPLVVVESEDDDAAAAAVTALRAQGIILSSRGNGVRVSFHAYNSADDVAAVLEALDASDKMKVQATEQRQSRS